MKHIFSKQNLLAIFIIIIVSFPAIAGLMHKGFFATDDGEWMVIRFSAFHQALRDGEFPVRFLGRLNQEHGYPVANFLYPGFMYLAEPVHLVGFGFVDSVKVLLVLSMVLSGVFAYLWLRNFFDRFSSAIGALFYLYTPYHLYDLYKRGSVGELVALALLPFILWQIERKNIFWSAIGLGLLLISHNTLAGMFTLFLLCYLALSIVISKNKKPLLRNSLFVMLLGFGLAAFFWIPALFELPLTVFSQTTVANWSEYFAPLPLVGYSTIVVLLLIFWSIVSKKIVVGKHRLTLLLFSICLLTLFLSLSISSFLWNILPVGFVQFPFRFLSVTIACVAFLAALLVSLFKGKKRYIVSSILICVLLFSALPFLKPTEYFDKGDGYYTTNMATTTVQDEYMPVWVKEKPQARPAQKVEVIKGKGEIANLVYNNKKILFTSSAKTDTVVQLHTIYWPGWRATVDGKKVAIVHANAKGLLTISVPPGSHSVRLQFDETPLRLVSDLISLLSLALLIFLGVKHRKKS